MTDGDEWLEIYIQPPTVGCKILFKIQPKTCIKRNKIILKMLWKSLYIQVTVGVPEDVTLENHFFCTVNDTLFLDSFTHIGNKIVESFHSGLM